MNKDFKHETEVIDNLDFQYPEDGYFVTNCTQCTNAPSCHDKCIYEKDEDKDKCSAMNRSTGYCQYCNCHWSKHSNMKYKIVATKVKKLLSVKDIEEKYKAAAKNCDKQTDVLDLIKREQERISKEFQQKVAEIRLVWFDIHRLLSNKIFLHFRDCIVALDKIALKTAPTDAASYIEQMIATEKMNQEPGYEDRIKELEEEKKNAENLDKIIHGGDLAGYKLQKINLQSKNIDVKKIEMKSGYQGYEKNFDQLNMKEKEYEDHKSTSITIDLKPISSLDNIGERSMDFIKVLENDAKEQYMFIRKLEAIKSLDINERFASFAKHEDVFSEAKLENQKNLETSSKVFKESFSLQEINMGRNAPGISDEEDEYESANEDNFDDKDLSQEKIYNEESHSKNNEHLIKKQKDMNMEDKTDVLELNSSQPTLQPNTQNRKLSDFKPETKTPSQRKFSDSKPISPEKIGITFPSTPATTEVKESQVVVEENGVPDLPSPSVSHRNNDKTIKKVENDENLPKSNCEATLNQKLQEGQDLQILLKDLYLRLSKSDFHQDTFQFFYHLKDDQKRDVLRSLSRMLDTSNGEKKEDKDIFKEMIRQILNRKLQKFLIVEQIRKLDPEAAKELELALENNLVDIHTVMNDDTYFHNIL